MGKLNVSHLRYLTPSDIRVLIAVSTHTYSITPLHNLIFQIEQGTRNHQLTPASLAANIANLRGGGVHKLLMNLCKERLLTYERGKTCTSFVIRKIRQ